MSIHTKIIESWIAALVAFAGIPPALADERAVAEASITASYRTFESSFSRKDIPRMYAHCDPSYYFVGLDQGKSDLNQNRRAMEENLAKLRSIAVRIEPEAMELVGNMFLVRYKQTHEVQFPLKPLPSITWFVAEDTWEKRGGHWRLMSTKVVNDSVTAARQRLEVQKKQMEFEDAQRQSRRCLNGLGYQCGSAR